MFAVMRVPQYRVLGFGNTALFLGVHAQTIGGPARELAGSNAGSAAWRSRGVAMLAAAPLAGMAAHHFARHQGLAYTRWLAFKRRPPPLPLRC